MLTKSWALQLCSRTQLYNAMMVQITVAVPPGIDRFKGFKGVLLLWCEAAGEGREGEGREGG